MKANNNKGFSLVELIVVIAIMAILVGMLAPQFIRYVERSRMSTDIQNIANVCHVIETYAADYGNHGEPIPDYATFDLSYDADISTTDPYLQHAFEDQAITECRLKSNRWLSSSSSVVTIIVRDLGKGMPYFTESGVKEGLSIIDGDPIED